MDLESELMDWAEDEYNGSERIRKWVSYATEHPTDFIQESDLHAPDDGHIFDVLCDGLYQWLETDLDVEDARLYFEATEYRLKPDQVKQWIESDCSLEEYKPYFRGGALTPDAAKKAEEAGVSPELVQKELSDEEIAQADIFRIQTRNDSIIPESTQVGFLIYGESLTADQIKNIVEQS